MSKLWELQGERVVISGNLDQTSLQQDGWKQLSNSERTHLLSVKKAELHFQQIEHVDSAGLAWVLNWLRDANAQGVELTLHNVPDKLIQLAGLSNVASLLPIHDGTL